MELLIAVGKELTVSIIIEKTHHDDSTIKIFFIPPEFINRYSFRDEFVLDENKNEITSQTKIQIKNHPEDKKVLSSFGSLMVFENGVQRIKKDLPQARFVESPEKSHSYLGIRIIIGKTSIRMSYRIM